MPQSQTESFVSQYGDVAFDVSRATGIRAEVALAQAAFESGWGTALVGNNLLGIKGAGVVANTQEDFGKGLVGIRDSFRSFLDKAASFFGWGNLMNTNIYSGVPRHGYSAREQIAGIRNAGYATLNKNTYIGEVSKIANQITNTKAYNDALSRHAGNMVGVPDLPGPMGGIENVQAPIGNVQYGGPLANLTPGANQVSMGSFYGGVTTPDWGAADIGAVPDRSMGSFYGGISPPDISMGSYYGGATPPSWGAADIGAVPDRSTGSFYGGISPPDRSMGSYYGATAPPSYSAQDLGAFQGPIGAYSFGNQAPQSGIGLGVTGFNPGAYGTMGMPDIGRYDTSPAFSVSQATEQAFGPPAAPAGDMFSPSALNPGASFSQSWSHPESDVSKFSGSYTQAGSPVGPFDFGKSFAGFSGYGLAAPDLHEVQGPTLGEFARGKADEKAMADARAAAKTARDSLPQGDITDETTAPKTERGIVGHTTETVTVPNPDYAAWSRDFGFNKPTSVQDQWAGAIEDKFPGRVPSYMGSVRNIDEIAAPIPPAPPRTVDIVRDKPIYGQITVHPTPVPIQTRVTPAPVQQEYAQAPAAVSSLAGQFGSGFAGFGNLVGGYGTNPASTEAINARGLGYAGAYNVGEGPYAALGFGELRNAFGPDFGLAPTQNPFGSFGSIVSGTGRSPGVGNTGAGGSMFSGPSGGLGGYGLPGGGMLGEGPLAGGTWGESIAGGLADAIGRGGYSTADGYGGSGGWGSIGGDPSQGTDSRYA